MPVSALPHLLSRRLLAAAGSVAAVFGSACAWAAPALRNGAQAVPQPLPLWALVQAAVLLGLLALAWRMCSLARRHEQEDTLSRAMLDHSPQLIALMTADGRVRRMNQVAHQWMGDSAEALTRAPIWLHPAWGAEPGQAERLRQAVAQAAAGATCRLELRLDHGAAGTRLADLSLRQVPTGPNGGARHLLLEARDVTVRRQAEDKLMLAGSVLEQTHEGILITDAHGVVLSVNPAFCKITGYGAEEIQGQFPAALKAGMDDPRLAARMHRSLARCGHWRGELRTLRKDGTPLAAWVSLAHRLDPGGRTSHLIAIVNDITQSQQTEQKLLRQVHFDTLTDLPNRHLLTDRLVQALHTARRNGDTLSLLFLDLNRLRDINDHFGHSAGDAVLLEVARRLRDSLRDVDTVARLGGDQFAVLLPGTPADGAQQVATKLVERLAQPCHVGDLRNAAGESVGQELSLTLSMGVAVYPNDAEGAEALMRCADTAMYRAKQEGRGQWCFYTTEMQQRSVRQMQLEAALRRAEERDELRLHYQPQLAVTRSGEIAGQVIGVEALIRWQHPELGMVSPGEFIPLAESSGQILAIGTWVLRTAVRQMADWVREGLAPCVVAVNLSALQFRDPGLPELVQAVLEEAGLPPEYLELELTESVAAGNPQAACAMMDRLHALGVRLSIDDFGTGFSSLNHLKRFPIHTLKIDQSFVRDITTDADDRAIVQAIIQMAHALRLTTIAEGVETDAQADFLRAHGCDMVQGYRYCRPQPPADALAWIHGQRQRAGESADKPATSPLPAITDTTVAG
ncbi:EAL domain-containing protein [Ideonella azotifigens]|nr:EAL domain-containing protein [Ideonella azotifigens]